MRGTARGRSAREAERRRGLYLCTFQISVMSYRMAVLMGVVLLRLWELWFSRETLRQAREETQANPAVEPYYPLMVLFHGAWLAGCFAEALLSPAPFYPGWCCPPWGCG